MRQDPKYKFGNTDCIYHREGQYTVPHDEPVMLLRGKDVTTLAAICAYVEVLQDMPVNEVVSSNLESSMERLQEFYEYQTQNADKAGVGCSQKHHGGSEKILEKARQLLNEIGVAA